VTENGPTPLETVLCGRCATVCDPEDNFCRHCGLALREAHLPSVRDGRSLPAVWRPRVPAVVLKGAAFVAAGTLAEVVVRRLVRRALGRAPAAARAVARRPGRPPADDEPADDAQVVSDTLFLRRVRVRR
jgi:hypothetical protein